MEKLDLQPPRAGRAGIGSETSRKKQQSTLQQ